MKTLKNLTFLLLAGLSILTVSCQKSAIAPTPAVIVGAEQAPFPSVYTARASGKFTVNTNAGATLISDTIAAKQLLHPDGIQTGQYNGNYQVFFFVMKPVNVVAGWNMIPLDTVSINTRNNANPAIIDLRSTGVFNQTVFPSSGQGIISDLNMWSFGAQLIKPLGSTATQPISLTVGAFTHYFTPNYISIELFPENYSWNANVSQLDNITPSSANIDLTTLLNTSGATNAGGAATFSGPGVSGTTFSPSSLTSGTYTIKATKVYDNGTFQISKTFTIH